MSLKVKGYIEATLRERFADTRECVVVSIRGIGGNDNNLMRGELAKKDIHVTVVKNSMAGKAFAELGMGEIKSLFEGPCAIAYGGDSVVDIAKELADWKKKLDPLEIKGAYVDGEVLGQDEARELSKMPSRAELQGTVVMLAQSPGRRVAGQLIGPAGRIAGCIKAIADKQDEAA